LGVRDKELDIECSKGYAKREGPNARIHTAKKTVIKSQCTPSRTGVADYIRGGREQVQGVQKRLEILGGCEKKVKGEKGPAERPETRNTSKRPKGGEKTKKMKTGQSR